MLQLQETTFRYQVPKGYVTPKGLFDGQEVLAPIKKGPEYRLLKCVVASAMGDTARVVNELLGVDTWFRLEELCIKEYRLIKW